MKRRAVTYLTIENYPWMYPPKNEGSHARVVAHHSQKPKTVPPGCRIVRVEVVLEDPPPLELTLELPAQSVTGSAVSA